MARAGGAALVPACLAAGSALSVWLGQDANWDLANYHLYDAAAFLSGAWRRDIAAAGIQSYFNPLLDVPYVSLALGPLATHPRVLAAAMGLWYGLLLWAAIQSAAVLHRGWTRAAATGLAVTGVATIGQTGTTFNEVATGSLVLVGMLVLLRGVAAGRVTMRRAMAAGVLFGLAAGFKPTALVYGAAAGLSLPAAGRAGMVRAWLGFALGGAAGAALAGGWWGWQLWQRFGNPVFPLFNALFRSPWYPPVNFTDVQHLPDGWVQWLFYPLWWVWRPTLQVTEAPSADPRLAIALLLGIVAVLACLVRRRRPSLPPAARVALLFTLLSYAAWLGTSSNLRYAVPIEVMGGLCVPLLLAVLWPGAPRVPAVATVVLLTVAAGLTRYPEFGRVPYGAVVMTAEAPWVEPGTLFVVLVPPSSYILPLLGQRDIAAVSVLHTTLEARGWGLQAAIAERVRAQTGPIVAILRGDASAAYPPLAEVGLSPHLGACRTIPSTYDPAPGGVLACAVQRAPPPRLPDPFWAQASRRYQTVRAVGDVWPFTALGYLQSAGPGAQGSVFTGTGTLLWGKAPPLLPVPRPDTMYILGDHASPLPVGPGDSLLHIDGVAVLAPGWLAVR